MFLNIDLFSYRYVPRWALFGKRVLSELNSCFHKFCHIFYETHSYQPWIINFTNSQNISFNSILILSSFLFRTLNNNNLTSLPHNVFGGLSRLRALRLSDNPFACDCHLSWLSRFLRSAPRLAPYTRCQSPSQLKGQNVADLHDQEFKCSGKTILQSNNDNIEMPG